MNEARLAITGRGLLADAIAAELAGPGGPGPCRVGPGGLFAVPGSCRAVIAGGDRWDTGAYPEIRRACAAARVPWLPVRAELGRVVIGPAEQPGVPGCADCAEVRRSRARRAPDGFGAVWAQHGHLIREQVPPMLTPLAAHLVAGLAAGEARSLAAGLAHGQAAAAPARTRNAVLFVDLRTLRVSRHAFLPDPGCPQCGGLPDDSAGLARIELRPRPESRPGSYRVRAVTSEAATLLRTYVDAETGLVRELVRDSEAGLMIAGAPVRLRDGRTEYGWGRTRSYHRSEMIALLEALERYAGTEPGGKRTVVRAPYSQVRGHAIDPRTLGLHPAGSYRQRDFPYRPFGEDDPYGWVWGYSFARQEPVLVPETCAYYGIRAAAHGTGPGPAAPFVFEISNGCALGGCLEEAILYGILEVAERDAFLMTWYAQMAVPRVDPDSARDRIIPTIVRAIRAETGYRTLIFDTTLEQGIPCYWVMAVAPGQAADGQAADGQAADGQAADGPAAVCAAGSHPDPERAIENALSELGPTLAFRIRKHPEERALARRMVDDPSLVREMKDHAIVNGDPAAFGRLSFLTGSGPARPIAPAPHQAGFGSGDLTAVLRQMIGRYLGSGLDVIVVDQTTAEHRAGGFSCVKVIIPGTLPMTFGHDFRRTDGLPRLLGIPRRLGYRDRRLTPADLNPHPHPFP